MIAVHAAQIQQAQKMNGVFVKIEPKEFQNMLNKQEGLMVIMTKAGLFTDVFIYLTSYKGFVFYCKSKEQLTLPNNKHEMMYSTHVTLPPGY